MEQSGSIKTYGFDVSCHVNFQARSIRKTDFSSNRCSPPYLEVGEVLCSWVPMITALIQKEE